MLAWTVRWPKGCTVAQKTRRLGKKGIKVVIVANLRQRMPIANDRFFDVAATIIAARSAMVDGMRLVAQPLLTIIVTNPFLASTLVALRPRFF